MSPTPAPDGAGVLVHANAGGDARNTFFFYTKDGKASSLDVGPNAGFLAWLPGATTALMHTSIGYDYRLHLTDWSSGKRLWEIPDPEAARVPGALPPVDVGGDYLLIGGPESVKSHRRRGQSAAFTPWTRRRARPLAAYAAQHGQPRRRAFPPARQEAVPGDGRGVRRGQRRRHRRQEERVEIGRRNSVEPERVAEDAPRTPRTGSHPSGKLAAFPNHATN